MSDAPERIWAWVYADPYGNELRWFEWEDYAPEPGDTEYVRADRIAALEAALADMTQQRDAAMAGAVKVRDGYRVDVFDLKMGGKSVPLHRAMTPANAIAALSRIEAQAEARGMRKAAGVKYDPRYGSDWLGMTCAILALADATGAAASDAERASRPALSTSQPGEASASSAPAHNEAAAKGGV